MQMNRPPGAPLPPATAEFLRFVLSREGQAVVAQQGNDLPLPAEEAARQAERLR